MSSDKGKKATGESACNSSRQQISKQSSGGSKPSEDKPNEKPDATKHTNPPPTTKEEEILKQALKKLTNYPRRSSETPKKERQEKKEMSLGSCESLSAPTPSSSIQELREDKSKSGGKDRPRPSARGNDKLEAVPDSELKKSKI